MTQDECKNLDELIATLVKYHPEANVELVEKAYHFAEKAHAGQLRKSGEPYFVHPLTVAGILAKLMLDAPTIAAGLLHDTVEDCDDVTIEVIEQEFGQEVALLVDGVTKLKRLDFTSRVEQQAESIRKMILAMSKDIRVVLIKLADRTHNMRTLKSQPPESQKRIAQETLDIYAPLAHRLGVYKIKQELEDLCLRYLDPEGYQNLIVKVGMKRAEREENIRTVIDTLSDKLKEMNIHYEIDGRPKHFYSIYRKMVLQHKPFEQIFDLIAIRVLVDTVQDCYAVLGVVHTLWPQVPGRFKDYIAMPKPNMYQSLHTTVIGPKGKPLEVQIRTEEMHRVAEYGIAAHWAYKEGKTNGIKQTTTGDKLNLFKEIIEIQNESNDAKEFMENVKGDLFSDRVYVFTPKGDVYELPKGSGPLDMAYSIHTEVGNHTTGAKVNGKIVPLDYQVKNGDIVDILTSQNSAGPSRDWLDLVHTNKAKNKIKRFFKQQDRIQNIDRGRDILDQGLIEGGYQPHDVMSSKKNIERVLNKKQLATLDDLYAAIGFGEIPPAGIINVLTEDIRAKREQERKEAQEKALLEDHQEINNVKSGKKKNEEGVMIEGIDNLLVRLSHCCSPIPGDEIVGYITKGRGVSVHRIDCPNVKSAEQHGTRLVDVTWNVIPDVRATYNTDLEIEGYNRSGLLNDVLQAINNTTKDLNSVNGRVDHNKMATIDVTVGIRDRIHLQRVIDNIKRIPDVYVVKRIVH